MPELVVSLKGREIRRIPILRVETKIGRDDTMDVIIDNVGVSRHHATIVYDGHGFRVRDEGSANGIYVNGNKSDSAPIKNGDVIGVGKFAVLFSLAGGIPVAKLMRDSPLASWGQVEEIRPEETNPFETMALNIDELSRMVGALDTARARGAEGARVRTTLGAPSTDVGMQLDPDGGAHAQEGKRLTPRADRELLVKRKREAAVLKAINVILGLLVLGMCGLMGYLLVFAR